MTESPLLDGFSWGRRNPKGIHDGEVSPVTRRFSPRSPPYTPASTLPGFQA